MNKLWESTRESDDQSGISLRLAAWAQFAGVFAGFLVWLGQGPDYGFIGSWLRLFLWSMGLGFAGWGVAVLASRLIARKRGFYIPEPHLIHFKRLAKPGVWIAAAALLILTLASHFWAQKASSDVVEWHLANVRTGANGYLGLFYDGTGWSQEPEHIWVSSRVNMNTRSHPFTKRDFFSTRHVAAFKLEQTREVEFKLSSDDGSLLLVDGLREIDHRGLHPAFVKSAVVKLDPGWHSIEVLHFQERGDSAVRLELPADLNAKVRPLKPDFDSRVLWGLNVRVQNRANRTLFMAVITLICIGLTLLPHPLDWQGRLKSWAAAHKSLLILLTSLAVVNCPGLNDWPGLDGDSAHHGLIAVDWYWRAHFNPSWAGYANQALFSWPGYALLHFFPLSVGELRWYTSIGNLLGLLFLGLAVQRHFGRRAALVVTAVVGLSGLFFFANRHFIDPFTYSYLGIGLAFFGLSRSQDHWWGALLCASGLSLLWQAHGLYIPFVCGFGLLVLMVGGLKTFKNLRFWLGLATLLAWNHQWIISFLTRGFGQPSYVFSLAKWWDLASGLLFNQAYQLLSGSRLALYFAGKGAWYVPPLTPLILLAAFALWPFVKLPPLGRRLGLGLLAVALVCTLMTARIITLQEIRYALPLSLALLLWLGLFISLAMESAGGFRRVFQVLACLLAASGLYAYAAWLVPQAREGGTCVNVPGAVFNSDRTINKRELYHTLAGLNHTVFFDHWDRFSMIFHESEDYTGHYGIRFPRGVTPGGLLVRYNCDGAKKPPPKAVPVSLGPYLDKKFKAYKIPPDRPGAGR